MGDVIAMEAVDGLRFTPLAAPAGLEAQFQFTPVFSDGRSGDAVTVELYLLAEANGAPVAENLDLKKAAKAVGEKSIELLHVAEINAVTGYIRGGCSPVGMKKQYPTVFHQTAWTMTPSTSPPAGSAPRWSWRPRRC